MKTRKRETREIQALARLFTIYSNESRFQLYIKHFKYKFPIFQTTKNNPLFSERLYKLVSILRLLVIFEIVNNVIKKSFKYLMYNRLPRKLMQWTIHLKQYFYKKVTATPRLLPLYYRNFCKYFKSIQL